MVEEEKKRFDASPRIDLQGTIVTRNWLPNFPPGLLGMRNNQLKTEQESLLPEEKFTPRLSSVDPRSVSQARLVGALPNQGTMIGRARAAILDPLPNDLTRMIYLASLRDCNSGLYLHPDLSSTLGIDEADRVLRACHEEVFRRLVVTPLSAYVLQLEEYIQYTRTEQSTVLNTWRSLQAYRATVPVGALPISAEFFSLNVDVALTVLRDRDGSAS